MLQALSTVLQRLYEVTEFHEPDLGNQLTAIAVLGTDEVRGYLVDMPLL